MRIIAGRHKGRRLEAPGWPGLRPTGDKLRETLFNIVSADVPGARVLDGCAGTGAVGLEALSRGAAHVTFLERDPRAADLIAGNLTRCGVRDGYTVLRADAGAASALPPGAVFDVVFLDPPYAVAADAAMTPLAPVVAAGGLLVLEHARRTPPPAAAGPLARTRTVHAGDSALSFYARQDAAAGPA